MTPAASLPGLAKQEGKLDATGDDVAPGFRLCTAPAKSILESGHDHGNFGGTAIYVDGQEVVLVCELQAGWSGMSATGAYTPMARSGRGSGSARSSPRACATSTITTSTGVSTSTS